MVGSVVRPFALCDWKHSLTAHFLQTGLCLTSCGQWRHEDAHGHRGQTQWRSDGHQGEYFRPLAPLQSSCINHLCIASDIFSLTPITHTQVNPINQGDNKKGVAGVNTFGVLKPFGKIGGDCSVNWNDGLSFGGGFNHGLSDPKSTNESLAGFGGGFMYNKTMTQVGAGMKAYGSTVK
jgi:hypothetical protein